MRQLDDLGTPTPDPLDERIPRRHYESMRAARMRMVLTALTAFVAVMSIIAIARAGAKIVKAARQDSQANSTETAPSDRTMANPAQNRPPVSSPSTDLATETLGTEPDEPSAETQPRQSTPPNGDAVLVSWDQPENADDIAEYRVLRNGEQIGGPASGQAAQAIAVADIAICNNKSQIDGHRAVAELVRARPNGSFIVPGDIVQGGGSPDEYECYDQAFGEFRDRTFPVPGNHEHNTTGAVPYFDYFGDRSGVPGHGWQNFNVGGWNIISVDSNCWKLRGGCGVGSEQYNWLQDQLRASTTRCSAVYWHHPRWPSDPRSGGEYLDPMWELLVDHGVELLLNGHEHYYARFPKLNGDGQPSETGVRTLVVGTGGFAHTTVPGPASAAVVKDNSSFGILDMHLDPSSYRLQFVPIEGDTLTDDVSDTCHGPNASTVTFLDPAPPVGEHSYRVEGLTTQGRLQAISFTTSLETTSSKPTSPETTSPETTSPEPDQ